MGWSKQQMPSFISSDKIVRKVTVLTFRLSQTLFPGKNPVICSLKMSVFCVSLCSNLGEMTQPREMRPLRC